MYIFIEVKYPHAFLIGKDLPTYLRYLVIYLPYIFRTVVTWRLIILSKSVGKMSTINFSNFYAGI